MLYKLEYQINKDIAKELQNVDIIKISKRNIINQISKELMDKLPIQIDSNDNIYPGLITISTKFVLFTQEEFNNILENIKELGKNEGYIIQMKLNDIYKSLIK